ncbi:hypothetical protein SLEP1_g32866 [Rubroshorea leprosula]|uniref:Uncharacterized protein n=1 Tax=Rubroshorea leprosula TaxID=152421 RepID=A0AAV5KEZ1_9ROSI|nr:hypothetical protein SLEP1_g32866 [Rubroshorea leprosula]
MQNTRRKKTRGCDGAEIGKKMVQIREWKQGGDLQKEEESREKEKWLV